ncbi:MAG TPA: alkaline phosphatase PhoX [Acidimicrobiales bacterium]|jgi:hypothetical protein
MTASEKSRTSRRAFIQAGAAGAIAAAGASTLGFDALGSAVGATQSRARGPHPTLAPVKDRATGLELINLPQGFEYTTFGWTTDPMDDGIATPSAHDGTAAFRERGSSKVQLVRNHEQGGLGGAFATGMTYDPMAEGGTTTIEFDLETQQFTGARASLAGTIRNCAGGPTPWRSWLSCEETAVVNGSTLHGYVFEVPVDGVSTGQPLRDLGRFEHEAAAVDPRTGYVYLTEDATPSGLYRFIPNVAGDLAAGGRLQMLAIGDSSYVTYADVAPKDYGQVHWVDIDFPDPATEQPSTVSQGITKGGAQFERLEGAWFFDGKLYFDSTSGGPARGQVFRLNPNTDKLKMIYSSPGIEVLDSPDNITVSPRGGIILCEDGSGPSFLQGLDSRGRIFPFAENRVVLNGERGFVGDFSTSEWTGATFEPREGKWMFVNIQTPGITFAITGPWRSLGL